jgi:hypothetical protein
LVEETSIEVDSEGLVHVEEQQRTSSIFIRQFELFPHPSRARPWAILLFNWRWTVETGVSVGSVARWASILNKSIRQSAGNE